MNCIVLTSYNPEFLIVSLTSIRKVLERHKDKYFCLFVYNDNPKHKLTIEDIQYYITDELLYRHFIGIYNGTTNLRQFHAKVTAIELAYKFMHEERYYDIEYFTIVDEDDILLEFNGNPGYLEINNKVLVAKSFRNLFSLIRNPKQIPSQVRDFGYTEGIAGNLYNMNEYIDFLQVIKGFFPKLHEIYGSDKIVNPDDYILRNLWRSYLRWKYQKEDLSEFIIGGVHSYAVVDRKYRENELDDIKTDRDINDVNDIRYNSSLTSEEDYNRLWNLVDKIDNAFKSYLNQNQN